MFCMVTRYFGHNWAVVYYIPNIEGLLPLPFKEIHMKALFLFIASILVVGNVCAASLEEDIAAQGKQSYLHKSITDQQLAASIRDYEDVTAVNTLTYSECGKTIFLNSATEFASTLPTPVAGCYFKFIIKAAPVGASYTVLSSGGSNIIEGIAVVNGATVTAANEDTITFTASAAIAGDWVELYSDGTSWYVSGQGAAATAIAFTAT